MEFDIRLGLLYLTARFNHKTLKKVKREIRLNIAQFSNLLRYVTETALRKAADQRILSLVFSMHKREDETQTFVDSLYREHLQYF